MSQIEQLIAPVFVLFSSSRNLRRQSIAKRVAEPVEFIELRGYLSLLFDRWERDRKILKYT